MSSFVPDAMGDIYHTHLAMKLELRKHLRRRRVLLTAVLAMLMPLIFYVVPPMFDTDFPDSASVFASRHLAFVNLLIIISAAVFAGDAISSEFETKTGLLLFPTPQRRTSLFVGRYLAALIATFAVVAIYYLVTILEIIQIYGTGAISIEFAKSLLLAMIYTTSALSVIYLLSSIMKRTITSTLVGFFVLMLISPMIVGVLQLVDVDPWFMVTHPASLITDVLGVQGFNRMRPGPAGNIAGLDTFTPEFYQGVSVMMAYAIIPFLISIFIADRKEMA